MSRTAGSFDASYRRPAEAALRKMLAAPTRLAYALALLYATLGDHERALDWIEQALDEPGGGWFLPVNPLFESLQVHPRYQGILQRLGIGPVTAPFNERT